MILARKFTLADDNDYERLAAAGGRLRALLEAFTENRLPPEYGANQLAVFARSLVSLQRTDGSFSSSADPDRLEPDVRTDAHRFVTWAALAFLCRFRDLYADGAADVEGLNSSIAAALKSPAAADFSFPESGPAEPVQQVEAVLILSSGGIPARLAAEPNLAPEMKISLDQLISDFNRRIQTGDTALPGGIEYSPLFRQALSGLET